MYLMKELISSNSKKFPLLNQFRLLTNEYRFLYNVLRQNKTCINSCLYSGNFQNNKGSNNKTLTLAPRSINY
ncbi:hypothetical protein JCM9140_3980 [Halalkalibacter wakoensis JCM 9140]|uniref:Uncharacterized protein n=1 Tax=Halalkalibacter wakoensis JCM 9140 TaxID=1236970 RepID=W4Q8T7_9BACI|nr:hypothetical protein JCM9140_3980 [Halalkalibacter wakoensis JCM 9140]